MIPGLYEAIFLVSFIIIIFSLIAWVISRELNLEGKNGHERNGRKAQQIE